MSIPPKPPGYSTVSPYLIAAGAQAVIEFLQRVFGAEPLRRYDLPDGRIMHAEVRIGDTVVMIGDAGESWPAVPAHLHVYVDDVDAIYRRAAGDRGPPRAVAGAEGAGPRPPRRLQGPGR